MINPRVSLDACRSYIDSQFRYRAAAGPEAMLLARPFITISRQTGAGGITIGDQIVARLNAQYASHTGCQWTLFDKNLIQCALEEHQLPAKYSQYLADEGKAPVLQEMLDELFGLHPSRTRLAHGVSETVLHLAHLGFCVIVGRGGAVVTRKLPNGFHLRLVGAFENRVKHMMELFHLDRKAAELRVTHDDQERADYVRQYLLHDINDVGLYHLIVNTDKLSYDETAELVVERVLARFAGGPVKVAQ